MAKGNRNPPRTVTLDPPTEAEIANVPTVGNYPPLAAWLIEHDARCLWQLENDARSIRVEGHRIGAAIVLVVLHEKRAGWNVFSAHPGNDIVTTLADALARVRGVDPARITALEASVEAGRTVVEQARAQLAGIADARDAAAARIQELTRERDEARALAERNPSNLARQVLGAPPTDPPTPDPAPYSPAGVTRGSR